MNVRFRFKTAKLAEECASKLPVACSHQIVTDRTSDTYLEVSENYEDYIERYLYTPYNKQSI